MASSLIIPRCEVIWGSLNLTSYKSAQINPGSELQPLVYDVRVSLQEGGQTPSGSMKWSPTGDAYSVYEYLLKEEIDKTITVRFFYLNGRSITFSFVYSGQSESYGQDMSLTVKLSSQLDGLINANIKSTAQNSDTGQSVPSTISKIENSFGVESFNLIQYTSKALEDLKNPKILSNYSEGTTFIDSVKNVAEQSGHIVTSTSITAPSNSNSGLGIVISGPFLSDTTPIEELPFDSQYPDPKKRYGFFLGPGIIQSLTKDSEWQPPQKTQTSVSSTEQKVQPKVPGTQGQPTPTGPQIQQQASSTTARGRSGASNTANSSSRPGTRIEDNEKGEKNKIDIQKERGSKLNTSLFMCPALTGMKPGDVLFIPNYKGTYIEDWLVTSIEYSQTDGGVELSVQAARQYGLGNLMNEKVGGTWLEKAKEKRLVGPSGTLEAWHEYAWGSIKLSKPSSATTPATTPTPSNSFNNLAKPFGEFTQVLDKGLYDYFVEKVRLKPINESSVFPISIEKARQLYESQTK